MKKVLVKPKKENRTKLQDDCDKLFQEIGRMTYDTCLVCNNPMSCLHHFVKKSQSNALRYDFENGVPLCAKCHASIHIGQNDLVVGKILAIKGLEWLDRLERLKKAGAGMHYGIIWLKNMRTVLKLALNK